MDSIRPLLASVLRVKHVKPLSPDVCGVQVTDVRGGTVLVIAGAEPGKAGIRIVS